MHMTWFERLTGFPELAYVDTKRRLKVVDGRLFSENSPNSYGVGRFELLSLEALRRLSAGASLPRGQISVRNLSGDARTFHQIAGFQGALFQVASQFNMLEMISPRVTPEDGVSNYEHDETQGPACAIAAGAATIYRNYFVPIGDQFGQTADRQLDGLAGVAQVLGEVLGVAPEALWRMQNGYALCEAGALRRIGAALAAQSRLADEIRQRLSIGLQWDVEVTDTARAAPQFVSQAFCSALPVAYTSIDQSEWAPFAQIILEAAYEATLSAAALNAARGASNKVLLTRLGGGAFGNNASWIDAAMSRALRLHRNLDLEVFIINLGVPAGSMLELAHAFAPRGT
ncbi:hypothetical protein [Phenylobacterium aquaticum]|uniref:hypothetical protein n=1 Tax=Phenylobacterium aquaticum TaxID=1763816 RepID=UPI001F5C91DC|nr:hypothetical protein [Phenylobacterium aquaticum]MCI3135633.1 hypothetical protein [Phenylobacterium aquaticum]